MQLRSSASEPARQSELENSVVVPDLPVGSGDLKKLARWVPEKEIALLVEICERARRILIWQDLLFFCARPMG